MGNPQTGYHLRSILRSVSEPFTDTVCWKQNAIVNDYAYMGLTVQDSGSGKDIFFSYIYGTGLICLSNNTSADNNLTGCFGSGLAIGSQRDMCMRVIDDGSYLTWQYSEDGIHFFTYQKNLVGAYLPARNLVGYGGIHYGSPSAYSASMSVYHYNTGTNTYY